MLQGIHEGRAGSRRPRTPPLVFSDDELDLIVWYP